MFKRLKSSKHLKKHLPKPVQQLLLLKRPPPLPKRPVSVFNNSSRKLQQRRHQHPRLGRVCLERHSIRLSRSLAPRALAGRFKSRCKSPGRSMRRSRYVPHCTHALPSPHSFHLGKRTIRSLVIRAVLDWTDDFRHQDVDKMAMLFRAVRILACSSMPSYSMAPPYLSVLLQARTAHPILNQYANNWATAAIACQYMQNKRKYSYKQGYISKRRTHQVRNQANTSTLSHHNAGGA